MSKKEAAKRPIGGEGTGVMYAFLLSLGAAITAAGIALVASGISLQDRAFDASAAVPGIVAIIGGCVLIGLSLVVRALLRVERALTARASARPAQTGEASADTSIAPTGDPNVAVPAKAAAAANSELAAAEQVPAQAATENSATTERLESAPLVEAGDVSLLPKEPARSEEDHGAGQAGSSQGGLSQGGLANGKLNGASHTTTAPRLAGGPGRRPQPKNSIFDTLWPKGSAAAAAAQVAPIAQSATVAAPVQSAPAPAAEGSQIPAPVSILKSGVVEGMAYTLYSDGSIEAQLPGGTMRFSSITELRSHIEQNG